MSKKIAVKVCSKVIVASISESFLDEITSFMKENHYTTKAELARAAIRKLLNGEKICDFMDSKYYGSKAELLREALREFIKPEVQIVSQNISSKNSNIRPWEFDEPIKTKSGRKLPIIPGTPEWHRHKLQKNKKAVINELKEKLESRRRIIESYPKIGAEA